MVTLGSNGCVEGCLDKSRLEFEKAARWRMKVKKKIPFNSKTT
jgi:hypothetical protein